jgi:hypothetical protein
MAGSPKKRARKEQAAQKRLEIHARQQADEKALKLPRRVRYTPKLSEEIKALIAAGIPIEDPVLNGVVISQGVATRLGISSRAIYDWQKEHPELAQGIARAREESGHRIADRLLALADVALREPAMANAVRVAADILRWQAMVRNPGSYGERHKVEAAVTTIHEPMDYMEMARRIQFILTRAERPQPDRSLAVLPSEIVNAEIVTTAVPHLPVPLPQQANATQQLQEREPLVLPEEDPDRDVF